MLLGEWCSQQIPGPAAALKLLCWSLHTLESSASELQFAIIRILCFPLDHTQWNSSKCTEATKMVSVTFQGPFASLLVSNKFWQKDTLATISEVTDQLL